MSQISRRALIKKSHRQFPLHENRNDLYLNLYVINEWLTQYVIMLILRYLQRNKAISIHYRIK